MRLIPLKNLLRARHGQSQAGQSLIETIVAMSILITTVVACLGLTLYAITMSSVTHNELIANNLAREAVEVVRMMRDTNWLSAGNVSGAANFYTSNGGCTFPSSSSHSGTIRKPCYPEAFQDPFDIQYSTDINSYRAVFNPSVNTMWRELDLRNGFENYLLCLQSDGTYRHNYVSDPPTCTDPTEAKFARRVQVVTGLDRYPYTSSSSSPSATGSTGTSAGTYGGHSPEKLVTVTVVWQGRGCAQFTAAELDPVTFSTNCKITLVERLSNWKDYQ